MSDSPHSSIDDRRVSFQEDVAVRYLSPSTSFSDSSGSFVTSTQQLKKISTLEAVESLSTDDSSSYRASDTPNINSSSLDMLCEDIISDSQKNLDDIISYSASTSKASTKLSKLPISFEDCFTETDLYMKETYPKYYQFLQTHIINAPLDTEDRKNQETEFMEAIVGCRQYPPEYFEDLENTLKIYDKINKKDSK